MKLVFLFLFLPNVSRTFNPLSFGANQNSDESKIIEILKQQTHHNYIHERLASLNKRKEIEKLEKNGEINKNVQLDSPRVTQKEKANKYISESTTKLKRNYLQQKKVSEIRQFASGVTTKNKKTVWERQNATPTRETTTDKIGGESTLKAGREERQKKKEEGKSSDVSIEMIIWGQIVTVGCIILLGVLLCCLFFLGKCQKKRSVKRDDGGGRNFVVIRKRRMLKRTHSHSFAKEGEKTEMIQMCGFKKTEH